MKKESRTRGKRKETAQGYLKVDGTFESVLNDISKGAKIEKREFWMKTEYWLVYKEGGATKISKRIYDKIVKQP